MINIASFEYPQFANFMMQRYGTNTFQDSFEIIKQNQNLIFENDGEDKLFALL